MPFIVVAVASLIAALLSLISGFGLGTLLLPAFAVFFPMAVAVAAVAVVHLANNIFKLGLVGRWADRKAVVAFGVPAVFASAGGALVLGLLSDLRPLASYALGGREFRVMPVDLVIGLLIVAFAFVEFLPFVGRLTFDRRYLPLGGLLSGFFGGLSGHQGAFRSAFLVKSGLSREAFLGTNVACAVLVDVARIAVYFGTRGASFLTQHAEKIQGGNAGLLVVVGIAFAFAGSFVGSLIFRKMTLHGIQRIVGAMLVVLGLAIAAGLVSGG